MKKKRLVLYGEKTVLLKTRRVPESKKDELEKMIDDFLMKCVKPGYVESENYLADESTTFPSKSKEDYWEEKRAKKPQKKIEPQVVEEELDEEDLLYAEYEKLEGTFEVLEKMPIVCNKTDVIENGHNVWTDNTSFYVKEKNGVFNKWTKFDRIEFAVFYIQDNLIRKN